MKCSVKNMICRRWLFFVAKSSRTFKTERGSVGDISSLFIIVPFDKTIQICFDKLHALPDPPTLPLSVLKVLLEFVSKIKKSHSWVILVYIASRCTCIARLHAGKGFPDRILQGASASIRCSRRNGSCSQTWRRLLRLKLFEDKLSM